MDDHIDELAPYWYGMLIVFASLAIGGVAGLVWLLSMLMS